MSVKHDSVVELLRKWVRGTRADGLGPLGTNLKELEEIADMVDAELKAEREKAAFLKVERDKLEEEVDELDERLDDFDGEFYHGGTIVDWYELSVRLQDDLEDTIAERDRCYMELPVDADGVPIRPGDMLTYDGAPMEVMAVGDSPWFDRHPTEVLLSCEDATSCRHVKPDTVESMLEEFYMGTHATTTEERESLVKEFAERIRKAVEQ